MAGQKKAPSAAPAAPAIAKKSAKTSAKSSGTAEAEPISKRPCEHCGELIPTKKILTVKAMTPIEGTRRSLTRNHYYHRDHYGKG
jgi:hypothetical protein